MIPEAFMRLLEKIETGQPLTTQEEHRYRKFLKNKDVKQFMKEREALEHQLESLPTPELEHSFVDQLMPQITQEMESRFLVNGFPGMKKDEEQVKQPTNQHTQGTSFKRWIGAGVAFAAVVAFAVMIFPQIEREGELAPLVDGNQPTHQKQAAEHKQSVAVNDESFQTGQAPTAATEQVQNEAVKPNTNADANTNERQSVERPEQSEEIASNKTPETTMIEENQSNSSPSQAPVNQPKPAQQQTVQQPAYSTNNPKPNTAADVETKVNTSLNNSPNYQMKHNNSLQSTMTVQDYNVRIENQRVVIRDQDGEVLHQSMQKAKTGVQSIELLGWKTYGNVYRYQIVSETSEQAYDINLETGEETKVNP